MSESITDTRRLAEEYTTLINERDYDRIPELVSESFSIKEPISGGLGGHEGLEQWVRQIASQFPDFHGEILHLHAGEETAMALVEFSMTPKSEVESGSPTSPAIQFEGMVLLRVEEGKLQEHRAFYDPGEIYEYLDGTDQ